MRKCFLFLFGLLISLNLFSQQAEAEIDIVYFNSSASYASGSEVSIHMDTKGIYDRDNNTFSLYLQDENGNETLLSSVNAFYSPLLNGTLPEGLSKETHFKLLQVMDISRMILLTLKLYQLHLTKTILHMERFPLS